VAIRVRILAVLAGGLGLAVTPAAAQSPLTKSARLQGQFQMVGQITVARFIQGEQVGQQVQRTWTFTPLCGSGQCQQVTLARQRAGGVDKLILRRKAPGSYAGSGRFYAPAQCGNRTIVRGVAVPFSVTVQIAGAAVVGGVPVATAIHATYVNRKRTNLTACVLVPGHDAAVYDGRAA
jgi:hypothetical protein